MLTYLRQACYSQWWNLVCCSLLSNCPPSTYWPVTARLKCKAESPAAGLSRTIQQRSAQHKAPGGWTIQSKVLPSESTIWYKLAESLSSLLQHTTLINLQQSTDATEMKCVAALWFSTCDSETQEGSSGPITRLFAPFLVELYNLRWPINGQE